MEATMAKSKAKRRKRAATKQKGSRRSRPAGEAAAHAPGEAPGSAEGQAEKKGERATLPPPDDTMPASETDSGPADQEPDAAPPGVDFTAFNRLYGRGPDGPNIEPGRISPAEKGHSGKAAELLDEIAEDMLDITGRLKAAEATQAAMAEQVSLLKESVAESKRESNRQLNRLHRDLLSERKGLIVRDVFNAVSSVSESVRLMRVGLDPVHDERMVQQLTGIESTLVGLLQRIGFRTFSAAEGDVFDPSRMECLGYASAPPSQVVEVIRPGYIAGDVVVAPVGVVIGNPQQAESADANAGNPEQSLNGVSERDNGPETGRDSA